MVSSIVHGLMHEAERIYMVHTLDLLKVGQKARVVGLSGINTSLRRRLLDMGLTPNTKVELIRTAPLGDPMQLDVRGYALTLRKADAKLIEVSYE